MPNTQTLFAKISRLKYACGKIELLGWKVLLTDLVAPQIGKKLESLMPID